MRIDDIGEYEAKAIAKSISNLYHALVREGFRGQGALELINSIIKGGFDG